MRDYYEFLDENINTCINADVGFSCLLSPQTYELGREECDGFFARHEKIKKFQEQTLDLFEASLEGDADPEIAELTLNELPEHFGREFHESLLSGKKSLPLFFRTDEVIPGKISEIQCPGSLWGLYEQVYQLLENFESELGKSRLFNSGLAQNFTNTLKDYLPRHPVIHHLIDNASIPAGIKFFIQATRKRGLKYFGYSKGITSYDCNFIRAHAFHGLLSDNFFKSRLSAYFKDELFYDLPPNILFDEKIPLIFPFWEKTRQFYSREIREMFPFTELIRPEGFRLEDDSRITPEEFINLPRKNRDYYIKYAGSDLAINWGSKGVFYAGSLSKTKAKEIFDLIQKDYAHQKYWIIQKGYARSEEARALTRENELKTVQCSSKYSGFYGPNGLMGILVMQRPFYKV
ncbi:MAG: hypothetical protein ACQES5_10910, partial [Thermodesulfobacteriota bacterium]